MDAVEESPRAGNYDEELVVDHTQVSGGDHKIRLKYGLDPAKLMNDGVILEPEIDPDLMTAAGDARYEGQQPPSTFLQELRDADEETVARAVNGLDLNLDDDEDEDGISDGSGDTSFEAKGRRMTAVTDDGGVKKRVIKPGLECEGAVPNGGTVTVHYNLYLEGCEDEPFDSTRIRGKAERFKLDDGQLLPGLEIALKTMKNQEKAIFLIGPNYAYGPMGCPPRIPGNTSIMAKVEMLDFVHEGEADCLLAMAPKERSQKYCYNDIEKAASREHTEGNSLHKKGEYKLAARRYDRGAKLLEDVELSNDGEEQRQRRQLLKLYLNAAHCYLKVQWPKQACLKLQAALEIDPQSAKGLYRLGRAKRDLANYDEARRCFLKAQAVSDDPAIGRELASLDRMLKAERDNERALARRMMGSAAANWQRGGQNMNNRESSTTDEDYEEIYNQLKAFKKSKSCGPETEGEEEDGEELVLPPGMSADNIQVARRLAEKIGGLRLISFTGAQNKKQWKIVRT